MKKIIIFMITFVISMQMVVSAENRVEWSFDGGVLTVWGSALENDYGNDLERPWEEYAKETKRLVIKEGVTSVGDWSFAKFEALEKIEFPTTLEMIGERAFYNCSSLDYINLPEGLKTIKNGAFNSCVDAVRITLPQTLETIGDSAFMNIPKVPVLTVPESVEYIGMWAFMGCTSLEQLYFAGDIPEYMGNSCLADIYDDYILYYAVEHREDWSNFDKVEEEKLCAYASEERIPVYINNLEICFDIDPIIVDGRTLVPMRDVFEALGAVVTWNGEYETVTAQKDKTTVTVQIEADTMRKNNQIISLDVPAILYLNRTLVPVRAISEAFDAKVSWNDKERAVYIEIN